MKLFVRFALVVGLGVAVIGLAPGQPPQRGIGGGGGFQNLFGGKQQQDTSSLLRNSSVKKELRLTEDQEAKIPAAFMEALGKVLDADQLRRLKQIDLQMKDYRAFSDTGVQEALKLDAQQKADIKTIMSDADKETQALMQEIQGAFGGGGGGGGGIQIFQAAQAIPEKMQAIGKQAKQRCQEVLTAEQRRSWNEMIGDEFRMEQAGFDLKGFDIKGIDLKGLDNIIRKKK